MSDEPTIYGSRIEGVEKIVISYSFDTSTARRFVFGDYVDSTTTCYKVLPTYDMTLTAATSVGSYLKYGWTDWAQPSSWLTPTTPTTWTAAGIEAHRRIRTPEEEKAHELARKVTARQRLEAREKAEQLLLECLSDEQRNEYAAFGRFHVRSSRGRRYRIECERGRMHNVFEMSPSNDPVMEHCAHLPASLPEHDNLLAQKLLLELDEERFLRAANSWDLRRGRELVHTSEV